MSLIHILDKQIAERIAAGEVVERPASVVKELVENALDAGATAIQVDIRGGGIQLIRVSDNGTGIGREDLPLALERFATSKVHSLDDLTAIRSLGFRGEALPSIAAVAHVEILTRQPDEIEGTRLRATHHDVEIEPVASPAGTSVTVRDLFYNAPARRKYLKSPLREAELVRESIVRYSLAYPAVAFRLVIDGREAYVAPAATLLERIATALGRDVAGEMAEVRWEGIDLSVHGYISRPTIARSNREAQFFFTNGRPIRSGLLAVMLERPYAGRLPPGRHPIAVLNITVDPHLLDVNVHPRKVEVRFLQERTVYHAVMQAVENALASYPREVAAPTLTWPFQDVEMDTAAREGREAYAISGRWHALAQLHYTYILVQTPDGLAIIDQHAGQEQVLFERLVHGADRHPIEPPVHFDVTPREASQMAGLIPTFVALGFELEPFGSHSFLVRAVPEPLIATFATPSTSLELRELLTELLAEANRYTRLAGDPLRERLAMKAACLGARKAGDPLSQEQMQALVDQLSLAWSPGVCPHGRPALITLSLEELERQFLRR